MNDLTDTAPSKRVCICRQPYDGTAFMIECAICDGWFHGSCIGLSPQDAVNITEYFCPECSPTQGALDLANAQGSLSSSQDSEDSLSDSDLIAILSRPSLPGAGKGKGLGKGKAPRQNTAKAPRSASKAPRMSTASPATNDHSSSSSKAPHTMLTSAGKAPRGTRTAGKKTLFTHMAASTTDDDNSDTSSDAEASSSSSSSSSSDSELDETAVERKQPYGHAKMPPPHISQHIPPTIPTDGGTLNLPVGREADSTHAETPTQPTLPRRGGRGGFRGRGRDAVCTRSRGSLPAVDDDSSKVRPTSSRPSRVACKEPRTTQPFACTSDEGEHGHSSLSQLPLTTSSVVMSAPLPDSVSLGSRSKPNSRPRKSSFSASRSHPDSLSGTRQTRTASPPSSIAGVYDEPLITESDFEKLMAQSSSQHQSTSSSFGPLLGQAVSSMLLPSLAEDSDACSSSTRNNKSGIIRVPVTVNKNGPAPNTGTSSTHSFRFPSSDSIRAKPSRSAHPTAHTPNLFPMYPPIPMQPVTCPSTTVPLEGKTIPSHLATVTRPAPVIPSTTGLDDDDETDIETEDDADATLDDEDEDDDDELDDDMCVVCDTKCTCKPKQSVNADPRHLSPPMSARSDKNPKLPRPTFAASPVSPPLFASLSTGSAAAPPGRTKSRQVTPRAQQRPSSPVLPRDASSKKRSALLIISPPPLRPMSPSTIMSPPTSSRKRTGRPSAQGSSVLPSVPHLGVADPLEETESDEEELVVHVPRSAHQLPPSRFGRGLSLDLSDGTISSGDSTLSEDDSEFASEVLGVISAHPTGPREPMDEEDAVRANVSTFAGLAAAALALLSSSDSSSDSAGSDSDMTVSSKEEDGFDGVTDEAVGRSPHRKQLCSNAVAFSSIQGISDAEVTRNECHRGSNSRSRTDLQNKDNSGVDGETDVTLTEYQTDDSLPSNITTERSVAVGAMNGKRQGQATDEVVSGGSAMGLDVLLSTTPSAEFSSAQYPSFVQSVVSGSSPSLYKDGFNQAGSQLAMASRTRKISLKDFGLGFLAPPSKRPRDDHLPTTFEGESPPRKALLTSSHVRSSHIEPPTKRQRRPANSLAPIVVNPLTVIANDMATSPFTFKRQDGAPHTPTTPAMLGLDQIVDAGLFASSDDDDLAAAPPLTASPSGRKLRSPHRRDGRARKISTTSHAFSAFRANDVRSSNPTDPNRAFKGHTNASTLLAASLAPISSPFVDQRQVQTPVTEKTPHCARRGSIGRLRRASGAAAPPLRPKPSAQLTSEGTLHHSEKPSPASLDMSLELDQWMANPSQTQDFFSFGGETDSAALGQDVDPDFMAMDVLFSETRKSEQ